MEICMLDQVFQRTRRNEEKLDLILSKLNAPPKSAALVRDDPEPNDEAETA
jgi:hypothetical protein